MADFINYADKYSSEIDERFSLGSVTEKAVNNNYDFDGVNKVFIYSVDVANVSDYEMTGRNRYGTPVELGNRVQECTLSQDKCFTFTIDRRNNTDTMMTQHAGRCLQRQIDEVIVPMIDKYRLNKLADAATVYSTAYASVYAAILGVGADMTEAKVPKKGRIIFITPATRLKLLTDSFYTGTGDAASKIAQSGEADYVDGMEMIVVPSEYLPANTAFLITHPCAMCSPVKLAEYNVHETPPGISGWLVEGRTYYDAFVLDNKKKAIAIYYNPSIDDSAENETDNSDAETTGE
ncbi:MAG: N4-gp56 family major capsid protein [Oscillospiraceae bacterium]